MYEWSEDTNSLVRVSQGNGNGDKENCNSGWISGAGWLRSREKGQNWTTSSHRTSGDAYFYSPEQLDPSNPGVLNERNLYVYRHGEVQYVATFPGNSQVHRSQISPNGDRAAFLTDARLTAYDNHGWREMYTYDAETRTIKCASCIPDGSPPTIMRADPPGFRSINKTADVMASESGPFMANDGRVAFTTSDALVPQDTDGVEDVYEYVDSRPRLISSGTSSGPPLRATRSTRPPTPDWSRSVRTGSTSTSRPTTPWLHRITTGRSSSSTTLAPMAASRFRRLCSPVWPPTSATERAARRPTSRRSARGRTSVPAATSSGLPAAIPKRARASGSGPAGPDAGAR